MMRYCWMVFSLCLLLRATVCADVALPSIFGSNMVVQREHKAPVWGTAAPGEKIAVKFNGQHKTAVADAAGQWRLELDPMPAGGPLDMEITGANRLVFNNVMIGEVWFCSGQSNMQWPVSMSLNAKQEIAAANHPEIRLFYVPRLMSNTPRTDVNAAWQVCSPQTVGRFSATAYFFGRELRRELNVAVGLINASWNSTRIEPWTPPAGFQSVPALSPIARLVNLKLPDMPERKQLLNSVIQRHEQWLTEARTAAANGQLPATPAPSWPAELLPFINYQSPTVLYNAMVHPLAPFGIRGAIWYQGEANRGEAMLYRDKMQALINGWRLAFKNPELPFYFVQLAPNDYGNNPGALPEIWEAQTAALAIPHTGMAVTMDIGDVKDIHPKNKQEVGRRLALQALRKTYGRREIVCDSPLYDRMQVDGGKAVVTFKNAVELKTRNGKAPDWFELCGQDGIFVRADAIIAKNSVILSAGAVKQPVAVRFAWDQLAEPNLVNEAGLPAAAFRAGALPATRPPATGSGMLSMIREAGNFKLALEFNPVIPMMAGAGKIAYSIDKRHEISRPIDKIAYYLELVKTNGIVEYIFVAMDPFTQDLNKIGVPDLASRVVFHQKVSNLLVKSNVSGIKNGLFPEGGVIEFWGANYGQAVASNIPGASVYGFGDLPTSDGDYGSMQIHNYVARQTLFAYNNWKAARAADLGIGNAPGAQPDWTYLQNAGKYAGGKFQILVRTRQN